MCEHGTETPVTVTVPADLSHSGVAFQKTVGIDACIAPLVAALESGGVAMRGSCCGHGKEHGTIQLADGRTLLIIPAPPTYPDGSVPSPETPIDADCWRDVLDVRTLNALIGKYAAGFDRQRLRSIAPKAGDVLSKPGDELIQIPNLGPKGIDRIRQAEARMRAHGAPEGTSHV